MFKLGTQLGAGASVHFPATLNMSDKNKHLGRFWSVRKASSEPRSNV